jgi:cytochrome c oxidase assembly factor CtaG
MSLRAGDVPKVDHTRPLSPGVWIAAAAEIAVALAIATLMLRTGGTAPATGHAAPGMSDMRSSSAHESGWDPVLFVAAGLTVAAMFWWLATRARIPAILAAAGLAGIGTSETVRVMALHSHLVGMAALEALLVGVPLLLVATVRQDPHTAGAGHSRICTAWVLIAVALNSALLIGLHLPPVHNRGAHLDIVPLWLTLFVVATGLAYWGAILLTAGRVGPAWRRGALIIGQEVAAVLGLAAVLRPSPHTHHCNALGLSPTMDQRLGGVLMLVACAVVTLPLAKRSELQRLRTERDVH